MDTEKRLEILALLKEWFQEENVPAEIVNRADEPVRLRLWLPLFEDGDVDSRVLMEIAPITYNEPLDLAHIYTTMLAEPGPGVEELRRKLQDWNLTAFVGAYGIFEEMGQLYHKHSIVLMEDLDEEEQADLIFMGACVAADEMARRFPEAVHISNGGQGG